MLLVVIALLCIAVVPSTGGDLRRLGTLRPRLLAAAVLSLLVQIIITEVWTSGNHGVHGALQGASYALASAFVARWCVAQRVETVDGVCTVDGVYRVRDDDPTPPIRTALHKTP